MRHSPWILALAAAAAACARQPDQPAAAPQEVAGRAAALETPPPPAPSPCLVFGALTTPAREVRFFTIDPAARETRLLGEALASTEVAGIAVHPASGVLYALVARRAPAAGYELARVDRATGALTIVGPTGLDHAAGLAVSPADGLLYTWAVPKGPARLDEATGAASVLTRSNAPVTDLAWDPAGRILYAAAGPQLHAWDAVAGGVVERARLPVTVGGVAMRADGRLLVAPAAPATGMGLPDAPPGLTRTFELLVVDPSTGVAAASLAVNPLPADPAHPLPGLAASRVDALTWSLACGNPSPGGRAHLIDGITVEPGAVCSGESTRVTVQARHPEGGASPVLVSIGGLPGPARWVQLEGVPAVRKVNVTAWTAEGHVDTAAASVEVRDCGAGEVRPVLRVRGDPYHASMADLDLVNATAVAPPGSRFVWDFGDGTQQEGMLPFVRHAYGASIPRDAEYPSFDATLTIVRRDGTSVVVPRTVSFRNAYAADRRRGLVRPPSIVGPAPSAVERAGRIGVLAAEPETRTLTVTNVEDVPIALSRILVEHQPCDPDVPPVAQPERVLDVQVAPGQSWSQTLVLPGAASVCGLAVHVTGSAGVLRRVAVDAYVPLRRSTFLMRRVSDSNTLAALHAAVLHGLAPGDVVDEELLFQLSRERRIPAPGNGAWTPPPPPPDDPILGQPCQPGDPPPHAGVTCQATDEWEVAPPQLKNALKGDVVIATACGFVGDLLRSVSPAQVYSHSGIMTRNHYEITHSTAADLRYPDYPEGGGDLTEGIEEAVLKYGWPGIIRQSVEDAFQSVGVHDPGGKYYALHGFSQNPAMCPTDSVITIPKVIRPPPGSAASVRATLEAAAELARATSSTLAQVEEGAQTGHYRLYAYTDTSIALRPEFDWNGPATMCSGLVWRSLKLAGATLEGDQVESEDWAAGARLAAPDGLYAYDESERYAAGKFIHDYLIDKAFTQAGWFGDYVTDAADQLANQMTNCFAMDSCGYAATNSEAWQGEAGTGRAVSPEDILFWDAPETGGVYGHDEPLVYRSGEYVRKHAWGRSDGAGDAGGIVTFRGAPYGGARVVLYADTTREAESAADGTFAFPAVPAGSYTVTAERYELGVKLEVTATVQVVAGETAHVELALNVPPAYLRRVVFQGPGTIVDDEWSADDEVWTGSFYAACAVDPFAPEADADPDPWPMCVGGEVMIQVWLTCRLEPDLSTVRVFTTSRLWEQTDCSTSDEDGIQFLEFTVPADGTAYGFQILLANEDEGGDWAQFDLTATNGAQ